jgi:hypothetical protein
MQRYKVRIYGMESEYSNLWRACKAYDDAHNYAPLEHRDIYDNERKTSIPTEVIQAVLRGDVEYIDSWGSETEMISIRPWMDEEQYIKFKLSRGYYDNGDYRPAFAEAKVIEKRILGVE